MKIRKKLNLILIGLQTTAVAGIVTLATYLFTEDLSGVLRKTNFDVASILTSRLRSEFKLAADRMSSVGMASMEGFQVESEKYKFLEELISADNQLLAVGLYEAGTPVAKWRVVSQNSGLKQKVQPAYLNELDTASPLDFSGLADKNEIRIFKTGSSIRLAIPCYDKFLVGDLNPERLSVLLNEASSFKISLIDSNLKTIVSNETIQGDLPDIANEKLAAALAKTEGSQAKQIEFKDGNENIQMASIHPVKLGGLTVVSQAPYSWIYRAKQTLYRRTVLMSITIVCISIWFALMFSQGFTESVARLASAADRVAHGDYQVRLPAKERYGSRNQDELEEFSVIFNKMVDGLDERNQIKQAFNKLHSKDVAEKLIQGDLKLGGERKNCVVFFSDVRGFTTMSEQMDPEHIVSILNRYFTIMIRIVDRTGGNVTSFQGDGMMAVWGISNAEANVDRALKACLEMRTALEKLNHELKMEGRQPLLIGMGLHYGPVVAGNIGSNTRMEFTVIGDTANTASRVESATKEFGTDLLVSAPILDHAKNRYIVEKVQSRLKGKADMITLYKVHGYVDLKGEEILVSTPYSEFTAKRSEKTIFEQTFVDIPADQDEMTRTDAHHTSIDKTVFRKIS